MWPIKFLKYIFIKQKLKKVKLVACDVDGVLTNNLLTYNSDGDIIRHFNVKDGLGIKILQKIGIKIVLISGGKGNSILKRAKDLDILDVYLEVKNKKNMLLDIKNINKLHKDEIIYLGDDINDLVVKSIVGLFISPLDGHSSVKKRSDYITNAKGGDGVFREVVDMIIENKNYTKSKKIIWLDKN